MDIMFYRAKFCVIFMRVSQIRLFAAEVFALGQSDVVILYTFQYFEQHNLMVPSGEDSRAHSLVKRRAN